LVDFEVAPPYEFFPETVWVVGEVDNFTLNIDPLNNML
jgi:hypothetical protein